MTMQVDNVEAGLVQTGPVQRAGRRLYLPTIVIAGLAAWLSWRGWTVLGQTGFAQSVDAGR
jgi:hypothetical protein